MGLLSSICACLFGNDNESNDFYKSKTKIINDNNINNENKFKVYRPSSTININETKSKDVYMELYSEYDGFLEDNIKALGTFKLTPYASCCALCCALMYYCCQKEIEPKLIEKFRQSFVESFVLLEGSREIDDVFIGASYYGIVRAQSPFYQYWNDVHLLQRCVDDDVLEIFSKTIVPLMLMDDQRNILPDKEIYIPEDERMIFYTQQRIVQVLIGIYKEHFNHYNESELMEKYKSSEDYQKEYGNMPPSLDPQDFITSAMGSDRKAVICENIYIAIYDAVIRYLDADDMLVDVKTLTFGRVCRYPEDLFRYLLVILLAEDDLSQVSSLLGATYVGQQKESIGNNRQESLKWIARHQTAAEYLTNFLIVAGALTDNLNFGAAMLNDFLEAKANATNEDAKWREDLFKRVSSRKQ